MIKRIPTLCFCLILTGCCEWFGTCDPVPVPIPTPINVEQELDKIAYNTAVGYQVPGVIVSIYDYNTSTVKDAAYYHQGWPALTAQSSFRVGSVTKMMVSVLLLRLQELQKINLTNPIQTSPYIITTINLMNHTAGLGNFLASPYVFTSNAQLVAPYYQWSYTELLNQSSLTTPFTHIYSNTGFMVAGRVAEIASGKPYNALLTPQLDALLYEHVFSKAGMTNTQFNQTMGSISGLATGIEATPTGFVDVSYVHPSVYNSAGAVVSNTTDLHRFIKALFNGSLISKNSLTMMTSTYTVQASQTQIAGLGIFMETKSAFGKKYHHGGTLPGYNCEVAYYEKYNKSIVVATNTNTNGIGTNAVAYALAQAELLLGYN